MNVAKTLAERQQAWRRLERLCDAMQWRGRAEKKRDEKKRAQKKRGESKAKTGVTAADPNEDESMVDRDTPAAVEFASLYRSACADLALATSYQMPPATETYLRQLVARAHNQLYRSRWLAPKTWPRTIFQDAPRQIYADPCVKVASVVFFGLFALSLYLGRAEETFPNFAATVVGTDELKTIQEMYREPLDKSLDHYVQAAAGYIRHNTGIGLTCFGLGVLLLPCLVQLAYNAVTLGTIFGFMARPDTEGAENFFQFVTAHGPFELTAIALAAGAGLRLGIGVFRTGGLRRVDSLRRSALASLPIIAASTTLFVLAAFTEGFISPSPLPYLFKAGWAVMSAGLISFYFVVLGHPISHRAVSRDGFPGAGGGEVFDAA